VATVSGFRLDRFEVTVGRFRRFVNAVTEGWTPTAGSGKHTHLNGGKGLVNVGGGAAYEQGWDGTWPGLEGTLSGWNVNLSCDSTYQTWTLSPSANEEKPIVCETWWEAYAFCIWDGGFLPSEAEWNYAATGGSDQRQYPWSNPPSTQTIDCTYANYGGSNWASTACVAAGANKVGSESPKGDAKWGHADLAGNVWEWNLDWYAVYVNPCTDCAYLTKTTYRVFKGGSFDDSAIVVSTGDRSQASLPSTRRIDNGFRCSRTP
jgi:formylglycine-generating enzyme required for sulfatase activity